MDLHEKFKDEVLSKPGKKPEYLIGTKHGRLEVIDFRYSKIGQLSWICKCDCGNTAYVRSKVALLKRLGCQSCTSSLKSANRNSEIPHYGYFMRKFKEYKDGAKKRHLDFELSSEQFITLTTSSCRYCDIEPSINSSKYAVKVGEPLRTNGVDRLDSSIGYTVENCVPCCSDCNYGKHSKTKEEFFTWVKRVYEFQFN